MSASASDPDFIPARESKLFLLIFGWMVRRMFRWHFSTINIRQRYHPGPSSRTIYYLNHTSWWDGIIPLLLNQTRFKQKARAIMEDRQMRRYPFFSWIGAFSIRLNDPRGAVRSLRYAMESMRRDRACLFIFPEGRIHTVDDSLPPFQPGLGWLIGQLSECGPQVDVVPVSIHIQSCDAAKPSLWILIGDAMGPIGPEDDRSPEEISDRAHARLQADLRELKALAWPPR